MSSTSNIFFVDFQGFQFVSYFVLKEVSILALYEEKSTTKIFRPPIDWNRLNKFEKTIVLTSRCFEHGFHWNSGNNNYENISQFFDENLKRDTSIVYMNGQEKIDIFKSITDSQYDTVDVKKLRRCHVNFFGPEYKIRDDRTHCKQHDLALNCSEQNTYLLRNYYYSE